MIVRNFEIRILKNKDLKKGHTDARLPQESTKPDAAGNKGKYYQVSILAAKITVNGFASRPQGKAIVFNVFDNGNRALLFQDIADALANDANCTLLSDGSILLEKTTISAPGNICREETGFAYYITNAAGEKILGANKLPIQSTHVQAFIFDFEDETGLGGAIIDAEIRRAMKHRVPMAEDKLATTTTVD
jgi:hypothetical protein